MWLVVCIFVKPNKVLKELSRTSRLFLIFPYYFLSPLFAIVDVLFTRCCFTMHMIRLISHFIPVLLHHFSDFIS